MSSTIMIQNDAPVLETAASTLAPIFYEGVELNLNVMIQELKKLNSSDTQNGKIYWKTYGNWETQTNEQKNKSIIFWRNNITQDIRDRIIATSNTQVNEAIQEENSRQAITTKHDLARLCHLRKDPGLLATFYSALDTQDRVELDARVNSWNQIAEAFNDYERYSYQNACIVPGGRDNNGNFVSVPGMEAIANICWELKLIRQCQVDLSVMQNGAVPNIEN